MWNLNKGGSKRAGEETDAQKALPSPNKVLEKDMPTRFTRAAQSPPQLGCTRLAAVAPRLTPPSKQLGRRQADQAWTYKRSTLLQHEHTQHFRRAQDLTRMCARRREGGAKGAYGLSEDFCWLFWVNPKKKEFTAAGGRSVNDCFWTSFT